MQRGTKPCAQFVPKGKGGQHLLAFGHPAMLGKAKDPGQRSAAHMALGQVVSIVSVKGINGATGDKGNARRAGCAGVEGQAQRAAKLALGMSGNDAGRRQVRPAKSDPAQVQKAQGRPLLHLWGQVVPAQVVDEGNRVSHALEPVPLPGARL